MKAQLAIENKRRSNTIELEKLQLGKTTLKSIFQSKSGKDKQILSLQNDIEAANNFVEDYKKLTNFVTIYQGQIAIPKFKKDKLK